MRAKLKNADDIFALKKEGFNPDDVVSILNNRGISSVGEVEKLLSMREGLYKRSQKAKEKRKMQLGLDTNLIRDLGPIVGSKGNRDVTFAGWASTGPSAAEYIKSNKNLKDWRVELRDIDNDGEEEVMLYDDEDNIRRINGWGVKESLKPIRDNYFINNPTVASRKNITQSEWTRAVQVDKDGFIDYMFPGAQRFKKSRQEYYEKKKDKKPPAAEIKHVWQQYVAKPFIHMIKAEYPDTFKGLNVLPGMASATLSQHFSMHGFTYVKVLVLLIEYQGQDNEQTKYLINVQNLIATGTYGDEAYSDLRKNVIGYLKREYANPEHMRKLVNMIVTLADDVSKHDTVDQLIHAYKDAFTHLKQLFQAIFDYILDEYAGDGRENIIKGTKRSKLLYTQGRSGLKGAMVDDIRNRAIPMVHHEKFNEADRPKKRDQVRRLRAPADAAIYDKMMQEVGLDPQEYLFYEAWEEWYEDFRRQNVSFKEFMAMKIAQAKNQ